MLAKLMMSAPEPLLLDAMIASRRLQSALHWPSDVSADLVTVKVVAFAGRANANMRQPAKKKIRKSWLTLDLGLTLAFITSSLLKATAKISGRRPAALLYKFSE